MYSTDFREAVSVIEAARLIGVCRSRLYELLKDGDLKSIKLGKRRLVVRRSISELIRKLELIQASYDILEEIEPATVRAVCYRLFTAGIIPDMSERSTGKVSRQLTWARENDELPWEWIVDETRTPERVSSWADPKSYIRAVKRSYRKDLWRDQDNKVEVWSEKGTVRGTSGRSWRSTASPSACSTGSPALPPCTMPQKTAWMSPSPCSTSATTIRPECTCRRWTYPTGSSGTRPISRSRGSPS